MMQLSEATPLADHFLQIQSAPPSTEVMISGAELSAQGWTFTYQSVAYLRSGSMADLLGGNAPVLVTPEGEASFVPPGDVLQG